MNRVMRLFLLTFMLVPAIFSGSNTALSASTTTAEQQVLAVEKRRVQALTQNDVAALERILSDDLEYTHSTGVTETKAEYLAQIKSGQLKYVSVEHGNVNVRVYGATALLTGRTRIKVVARGQELSNELKFTMVYVRQKGGWRMVSWQSTRLTQ